MQLSEHFSYAELTKSTTAARKGISNAPSKEHAANLVQLCNEVLEPFTQAVRQTYPHKLRVQIGSFEQGRRGQFGVAPLPRNGG